MIIIKVFCYIEPHAYLAATLEAIVNGHKQSKIEQLLPWNYAVNV